MAAIDNPEAIRFVNEVVRPLCEEARSLAVRLNAMQTEWFAGKNIVFNQSGDTIDDGRESEGVSRLTAGDVTNAVAQLIKTANGQAAEWNSEILQKPCVRLLP